MSTLTPRVLSLLSLGLLSPTGPEIVRDDGFSGDPDDEGIGFGDDCRSLELARDGSLTHTPVFGWDIDEGEDYGAIVELARDGRVIERDSYAFGDEYDDDEDYVYDFGDDDDDEFGDDDDDEFGDDDEYGDDDDEYGDDDEFGDDDDEFGGREERQARRASRKRRRARRLNQRANKLSPRKKKRPASKRKPTQKRKLYMGATVISGTDTLTAAGTATVRIRLQHDFIAKDVTFEGSTAGTKITSIMFADRSVWSNPDGVPFGTFGVSGFLRGLLKGQRASRGVDITITGTLTGAGDLVATLTGGKPIQRVC